MRILVTGCGGFIGSHTCEALLAAGHDVVGLEGFIDSYPRSYKEANLEAFRGHPRFTEVLADLRDAPLDEHLEGVEVVVHLAAMPGLPRSWTDLQLYADCNLTAVQRLVEAAQGAGVRTFVHASTSSVYGADAIGDETRPTRPVSPYGVTKLACEHLLLAHHRSTGLPVTILRYFSIYGPRQRPDMAYHIFARRLQDGEPIVVFGDGLQSRSNTYVSDCVNGTLLAIEHGRPGEIYNIGGGESLTLLEAVEHIGRSLGTRPTIVHAPPRPGDQRHTRADTSKAARELGYRPTVAPAEGLAAQVEWHLTAGGGPDRREAAGSVLRTGS